VCFLERIKAQFASLVEQNGLLEEEVQVVSARPLSPEEAIGSPDRRDFPLLKGKEVMIQAVFRGDLGQAYTDQPGNYSGPLSEVLAFPLRNNFERAVFIASLNAVLRHLKLVEKTVHCRDQEPGLCAKHLVEFVRERFGNPRIAFIGLQPAMVENLAAHFTIRVTDLDPDNIGRHRCGVAIEDAERNEEVLSWGEIVLATGSTAVNGTLQPLLGRKPVVFYGVTVAGVARLAGLEQYCYCGH
jgi:hypothetical protein